MYGPGPCSTSLPRANEHERLPRRCSTARGRGAGTLLAHALCRDTVRSSSIFFYLFGAGLGRNRTYSQTNQRCATTAPKTAGTCRAVIAVQLNVSDGTRVFLRLHHSSSACRRTPRTLSALPTLCTRSLRRSVRRSPRRALTCTRASPSLVRSAGTFFVFLCAAY